MNRRRRNTTKTITPKDVVNAVMADLRAEGQSALIQWLSNKDHRFVMEQYAKGLLSPAAPEPEPLNLDSHQVYEMIKVYTLRKRWNMIPSSVNTSNKRVFFFSVPWHGVLTSGPGVSADEQGARAWGRNSEWSVVLPLEYGKEDNPDSAYVVLDRLWTDVDSVQSETVTFGFDRDQNAASAKILANFIIDYMEGRGAFPTIEAYEASLPAAPEPEPASNEVTQEMAEDRIGEALERVFGPTTWGPIKEYQGFYSNYTSFGPENNLKPWDSEVEKAIMDLIKGLQPRFDNGRSLNPRKQEERQTSRRRYRKVTKKPGFGFYLNVGNFGKRVKIDAGSSIFQSDPALAAEIVEEAVDLYTEKQEQKDAAGKSRTKPEPEPVAAPSGSLPISHEYREILFETVKKAKKALGLTSVKKKGDMGRFMRGTNMGTQVFLIERDKYGFWSLYSRDLPSNLRNMRPLTGDLKTDAQNIFKLIASANQQAFPRVDSFLAAAQKPKKTAAAKPSEAHPYAGHQADPNAVRRVGGEVVDWIEPLYPHVSAETAYVQDDYPQGRGDKRGERRTWVEYKPKKGFRFVYQTENLRRGGWWKPKPSTYSTSAIVMYLDKRDDRIYTRSLSISDSAERFDRFLDIFPDLPSIMITRIYRDAMLAEYLSAKYGDPETAKAKWSPVIDRLKAMQTRGNRHGRRRSNPIRKVLYSGG